MSLASFINLLRRRWILLVLPALPFVLAAIAAAMLLPPKYVAVASIKVDPNVRGVLDQPSDVAINGDSSRMDTEVALVRSPEVALAVVRRMGLDADPEFVRASEKRGVNDILPEDIAADVLTKHLSVNRAGLTYIINVQYKSTESNKAAAIANAVSEEYIKLRRFQKTELAAEDARSYSDQLGALGNAVEAADADVARYRAQTGTVGAAGSGANVVDQLIATTATELTSAESAAAEASSLASAASRQVEAGNLDAVSEVLKSEVVQDLRRQRTEVVRERARISTLYGPKHPDMQRVDQQVARLDEELAAEARRIVSGLQSAAQASAAREASLRSSLAKLRAQQTQNASAGVSVESLQRVAEARRAVYNQMSQAAQQASQQAKLGQTQTQIAIRAKKPTHKSFPNVPLILGLSLMCGAGCGLASVLVAESLDTTVRTADQVEQKLGVSLVGSVPRLTRSQLAKAGCAGRASSYVAARPISAFAESLRDIRGAIIQSAKRRADQVLLVTSALPGEGKTTTAISLARVMGLAGDKVLLVDCDLRRNALKTLARDAKRGLLEVLSGEVMLEDAVTPDGEVDGVSILPLITSTFTPKDTFGSTAMSALLREAKRRYDYIILDGPPALGVADARILAARAEGVLMIARWGRTRLAATQLAMEKLQHDGAEVVGIILSQVDLTAREAVGERNPSYYYKEYKNYYAG